MSKSALLQISQGNWPIYTNIFAKGSDPAELFEKGNRGLGELRWFRRNRLNLNLKKTKYVYFSGPGRHGLPPGRIMIG